MESGNSNANKPQGATDKLAAKRAEIMQAKNSRSPRIIKVGAVVVALFVAVAFWVLGPGGQDAQKTASKPATGQMFSFVPTTGDVTHPVAELAGGKPRFYQHKAKGGIVVRYFVMDRGGKVTAALDACASCWSAGKGHGVAGDKLTCRNCDKSFELDKLDSVKDVCGPIKLTAKVEGGAVKVPVNELNAGAKYFKTGN